MVNFKVSTYIVFLSGQMNPFSPIYRSFYIYGFPVYNPHMVIRIIACCLIRYKLKVSLGTVLYCRTITAA